ncbi:hypothetical protein CHS0354_015491 [Potamilus streckersoni]|uniref:Uncharacterized protein n=1 Tax=Potamilus streckersoni TaxID=2493646 RepID=A0AAE0RY77_9BIVA|nr:hypothetical protein CHS0354_015491 [Potamilus streckersoni]
MNSKKSKRANMGDQANRVVQGNHFEKQKSSMDEKELRDRMEAAEAMFTLSSLPIFMPSSPSPDEETGKMPKREATFVINGLNPPHTSSQQTARSPDARGGDSETRNKSAMPERRISVDLVTQVGASKSAQTQMKIGGSKETTHDTGTSARFFTQDLLTQIQQNPSLLQQILIRSFQAQQLQQQQQQQQQQSQNSQRLLQQPQQSHLATGATKVKPAVPVVLGIHNLPISLPQNKFSYNAVRKVSKDPPPQKVVSESKTSISVEKSETNSQSVSLMSDILLVKKTDTAENSLPLKKRRLLGMRDSPSPEKVLVQHILSSDDRPHYDGALSAIRPKNEGMNYKSSINCEMGTITGESSKSSGYLPLHGNPSTSLMVLSEVRNALVPDEDGDLPLHIAVVHEDIEMVQKFVDLMLMTNKSIDRFNKAHQTPLHLAVLINCLEAVRILLKGGANPNLVDKEGYTSFHLAAKLNQSQCLTILLSESKHDLDVNYRNYQGYAPIHTCVEMMSKDLVRQLLDAHADINITDGKSGRTALFHAVETRQLAMVDFLQSREANIDLPNYAGITPLYYAQTRNFTEISSILLKSNDGNRVSSLDRVAIPRFHVKSESSMSPISNRTVMSVGDGSSSNVSSPCQSGRGSPMDLSGAASQGSCAENQNNHVSHTDSLVSHTDVSCLPELEKRLKDTSNLGEQKYSRMSRLLFEKMETNFSVGKSSASDSKMLSTEQNDSKDGILTEELHQLDTLRDKVSELKFRSPGNPPVHSEEAKKQVGQRNSLLLNTKRDNSKQDVELTTAQISASCQMRNIKVEPTTLQSSYPRGYSQEKILQDETEVSKHETKVYQNEIKLSQHEIKGHVLDDTKVFQPEMEDSEVSSAIHGSKIQTLYFLDGTSFRPLQVIIDGETMTPVTFADTNSVESSVLNSVLQRVSQMQEKNLKHDSTSDSVSTSVKSSLPGSGEIGWNGEAGKTVANSHSYTSNKNTLTQETFHIKTERKENEMEKGLFVPVSFSSSSENSKSVTPPVGQVQRNISKSDLKNSPNAGKNSGGIEGDEQQVASKKIKFDTKKNSDCKTSSGNKPKRTTKRDETGTSSSSERGSNDSVPNLTLMSFPPGPGPNISKKQTNPVTVGSCLNPGRVPSTVANPRPAPVMTEGTLTRISPAIKAKISQALLSQRKQNRVQPPQSD